MHFFYSKTDPVANRSCLLDEFEFINDFGFEEYRDIRQKPLGLHYNLGIEICYVTKGRYEWVVGDKSYLLFPGDGFVTCPWQEHGSPREVVDLGEIYWIVIKPEIFKATGEFFPGAWSRFKPEDNARIGKVLAENMIHSLPKAGVLKNLFMALRNEVDNREFGYYQRICNITEELLIHTVRIIQNRESQMIRNQKWFLKFDEMLVSQLSRKWTLHEMATGNGVGITTLTQLVKEQTGYTPANYLIFLRLERAKSLLRDSGKNLTEIAYDCGFYSSQHFSSTFSRWVGKTPLEYRKI